MSSPPQPSFNPRERASLDVAQLDERGRDADRREAGDKARPSFVGDGVSDQHCRSSTPLSRAKRRGGNVRTSELCSAGRRSSLQPASELHETRIVEPRLTSRKLAGDAWRQAETAWLSEPSAPLDLSAGVPVMPW